MPGQRRRVVQEQVRRRGHHPSDYGVPRRADTHATASELPQSNQLYVIIIHYSLSINFCSQLLLPQGAVNVVRVRGGGGEGRRRHGGHVEEGRLQRMGN